ncbi:glycosyltransferase family 4 protein [Peptoniphilus sp. BV3AC2]|uniref:glycosyltransferase family 4 protein n=1 Tax=Peptoniphilus sp. BV3AC2 TaxID=1111133 RepID=UPI0003B7E460|nr:MraY family glycosyltransferase [Peptoniphilus sp. BV3AC2]ERT65107.1 putative undecaprenyl-phosphate N-acetylglucosaminyl 1-phosphate transferase [Peptoniphilus sp. BV3AC2]
MKSICLPFLISFAISLILTPVVIKVGPKFGYLDIPKDNRRMHKRPMPIAGGVAIYLAATVAILVFIPLNKNIISLLIGSTVILISGLLDDKFSISPKAKIFFQLVAGLIIALSGSQIEFFTNIISTKEVVWLKYLSIPVTLFWICGITNTVNLIDGLDGLAAGISLISAVSLMFIALKMNLLAVAIIAAAIGGGCLGFLPYNFNPAKIFMGDTGALYLGFMLSYISIQGVMKYATTLMIFVPVLVLGVPVFDTAFAMIRRYISGKKIFAADKGHLHHRLLALGLTQRQTVLILYAISLIFGILANVISDFDPVIGIIISLLIIILIFLVGWLSGMFKTVKKEDK